jgi:hypothetical protein
VIDGRSMQIWPPNGTGKQTFFVDTTIFVRMSRLRK